VRIYYTHATQRERGPANEYRYMYSMYSAVCVEATGLEGATPTASIFEACHRASHKRNYF